MFYVVILRPPSSPELSYMWLRFSPEQLKEVSGVVYCSEHPSETDLKAAFRAARAKARTLGIPFVGNLDDMKGL
jgi:hypothetical protein